jgi:hypothetical protein
MPNVSGAWSDDYGDDTITTRYFLPGRALGYGCLADAPTEKGIAAVRELRRDAAVQTGELHALNKAFQAARDFAACRELKDIIRYFAQVEKACTLILGWALDIGDKRTANWPQEFADLIDYAYHVAVQSAGEGRDG